MRFRLWPAAIFLCLSGTAQAADWWWIGLNGNAPNRVLTYVDRETIHPGSDGIVDAWSLAVGETPLPNGQQNQATHFRFRCAERSFATLGRIAYDRDGNVLPLLDPPPTAFAPVAANSIGESVLRMACAQPAGTEVHVDQPVQHARAYLRNQSGAAQAAAAPPANGPPPGAPPQPAVAADWWWIGEETDPAGLVYVNRSMIHREEGGTMEVFVMEIFDKPLPTGATRQVIGYGIDCRHRRYERLGGGAFDEAGHRLGASDDAPSSGTIPRGTIAAGALQLACGQPSPAMVHVADPLIHAGAYYHRDYPALPAQPPEETARAPEENGPPDDAPAEGGRQAPGGRVAMSFGTAFFVGAEGYALTAYHVVDGAGRLACRNVDGTVHEAVVARMNQANDIALLRVDFRPTRYLGLAPRGSLRPGERVFTIGYGAPNYLGINEPRFTEGVVSALSGLEANDAEVQITVPIQPGNSGGPLVNEAGQLVGIITASAAPDAFEHDVGATPQSINWAVKADYAAPLLPPRPPARPMTRAQAISLTHDSVCFVMAERGGDEGGDPAR